ncbi:MAG: glycosyltransferase family 4 protein [Sulfitobacter sp.]
MRLAFYAPMKSPDHPVPSGDRNIARALMAALTHMGADLTLASRLRCRDGRGDVAQQRILVEEAQAEISRLITLGQTEKWRAWVTYHNYYKAPDLIGPLVAKNLGIPYCQVESTRAKKRLVGGWSDFAERAEAATDAAAAVFYFTTRDAQSLQRDAPAGQHLIHLRPFLNMATLPPASDLNGPMLSVGMMRPGDKTASYQIIADTLALMPQQSWQLNIAGDGPAQQDVTRMMSPFGAQVKQLGRLDQKALQDIYAKASLMFWPGVNEAFGMVFLEAQAAGVPIVAQDRPGMNEVLAPGAYPKPEDGPEALIKSLRSLLDNPEHHRRQSLIAREFIAKNHLLPNAAQTLASGLAEVGVKL